MSTARWFAWGMAILILGGALRAWQIKTWPPTHDEMFTIILTRLGRAERLAMTANDVHPPLYYELQAAFNHAARAVLGREPGLKTMRLFPAFTGVLGIAVLLLGVGWLASRRAGLWAAAFWAVNPLAVGYSQNLRGYSLAALLVIGCLLAICAIAGAATARGRWTAAAALAASGLLLLYTHLLGGIFLAAIGFVWLWDAARSSRREGPAAWIPGAAAFLLMGLGFAPWLIDLARQFAVYAGHNVQAVVWATPADLVLGPCFTFFFGDPELPWWPRLPFCGVLPVCCALWIAGRRAAAREADGGETAARAPALHLALRLGFVLAFAFGVVWFASWRKIMVLYFPARVLLAAVAVPAMAVLLSAGRVSRPAAIALWLLLGTMFLTSLHRPLAPLRYNYLWERWHRELPAELRGLAQTDPFAPSPPRVVYPDFWAGLIPPDREGVLLIPFSTWVQDPRSRTEEAILIEPMPYQRGLGEGANPRLEYVLSAARRASGYPPAVSHDAWAIEAHTSRLKPFDAGRFWGEYERARQALPEAAALEGCRASVTAAELKQAAQGFYALEHDEALRFWRWTQGEACRLSVPGPFKPGAAELRLCLDRPLPYPAPGGRWPWKVEDEGGRLIARGELDFPSGGPVLFRLPMKIERPTARLRLELRPHPWQPSDVIKGSMDLRLLGGRFFWAGVRNE